MIIFFLYLCRWPWTSQWFWWFFILCAKFNRNIKLLKLPCKLWLLSRHQMKLLEPVASEELRKQMCERLWILRRFLWGSRQLSSMDSSAYRRMQLTATVECFRGHFYALFWHVRHLLRTTRFLLVNLRHLQQPESFQFNYEIHCDFSLLYAWSSEWLLKSASASS